MWKTRWRHCQDCIEVTGTVYTVNIVYRLQTLCVNVVVWVTFSAKTKIFRWSTPPNWASTFRCSSSNAYTHQHTVTDRETQTETDRYRQIQTDSACEIQKNRHTERKADHKWQKDYKCTASTTTTTTASTAAGRLTTQLLHKDTSWSLVPGVQGRACHWAVDDQLVWPLQLQPSWHHVQ